MEDNKEHNQESDKEETIEESEPKEKNSIFYNKFCIYTSKMLIL